jgi:hypothetical protein
MGGLSGIQQFYQHNSAGGIKKAGVSRLFSFAS